LLICRVSTVLQWRRHTKYVGCVRTPCQDNIWICFFVPEIINRRPKSKRRSYAPPCRKFLATPLLFCALNCLHVEMKLKQNSFKTVLKLFCFSFVLMCGKFYGVSFIFLQAIRIANVNNYNLVRLCRHDTWPGNGAGLYKGWQWRHTVCISKCRHVGGIRVAAA